MGNIIKFPNRNDRVKDVKQGSNPTSYQNLAVLGLGAVFLFAFILNISFQNRSAKNRELANYDANTESTNLNEYILESLNASDSNTEVVYSRKPTSEDKLIFETLMGSYDVLSSNGKISKIILKPGYKALNQSALPNVLSQYRKAVGMDQLDFKLVSQDVDRQNYKYDLLSKGASVGDMHVDLNADHQIISILSNFK